MISSLELARLCGVSQGTVDRALHGRGRISAATRERILAVAAAQGYLPNPAAQEVLGRAPSSVVGALVAADQLRVPFFMDLLATIAEGLAERDLRLSIWPLPAARPFAEEAVAVAGRRLRALLLVLPPADLALPPTVVAAQPVFSLLLPCAVPGVVSVLPDDADLGRAVTAGLLAAGHRRIVHFPGEGPGHAVQQARAAGYAAAMTAAGLEPWIAWGPVAGPDLLATARTGGATAAFCHHDPLALALLHAARSAGLRVPGDLTVAGIDRTPIAGLQDPALAGVAYPASAIAAQVVAHLTGRPVPPVPTPRFVPAR